MTTTAKSRTLIDGLLEPGLYPHECESIRVVETHISWVLLTGEFAYKIKKPVDLGFVDFTSLERRHHFCIREVQLNYRLSPGIYLGVVPIYGSETSPALTGTGVPIEYAIKMRQFDDSLLLDHIAGTLTGSQIDHLAEDVTRFHRESEVASLTQPYGTPSVIQEAADENFSKILFHIDDSTAVDRLLAWTRYQSERLKEEFEKRRRRGMVRECHGDMHLGNMFLEEGNPVVFDCIEFNDSFRVIDIMNEVAFTVMDLASHDRWDLAYRFLNQWLERTGDYAGLRVLRFYLVYRAMVRAKIACIRLAESQEAEDEKRTHRDEFNRYIDLATRFAEPSAPKLIITHGFSGSGKTTGTQCLVERGAVRVRSDIERKRLFDLGPGQCSSGSVYSPEETKRTYGQLAAFAAEIIESGFTAIVDATFLKKEQREQFRELAFCLGVPFTILDFSVGQETLRERIRKRQSEGTDASEADETVLDLQLEFAEPLDDGELYVQSGV